MRVSTAKISLVAAIAAIAAFAALRIVRAPEAPQVTYLTIEGERLTTEAMRGRVAMINFWATDCAPCIAEMPRIIRTYDDYRARGLEVVAVAMSYDPPNLVLDYAARNKLPFKVALDLNGDLARSFDVQFTPTTFIIDRRGRIVKRYLGEPDFADLRALLEAKLRATS